MLDQRPATSDQRPATSYKSALKFSLLTLALTTLSACGGSGGDDAFEPAITPAPIVPTPTPVVPIVCSENQQLEDERCVDIPRSSLLTKTGITLCRNASANDYACGWLLGLWSDSQVQAGREMSYTLLNQNGEQCIQDNVTGLIWEQKTTDDGLHEVGWRYTWFNSDVSSNGGFEGSQDPRDEYFTESICGNSLTKCNTEAYITALNQANYCGYSDWRMPSIGELGSIVDYGRKEQTINPIFGNIRDEKEGGLWYWSSSPDAKNDIYAWAVGFYFGDSASIHKSDFHYVRAVRSGQ